MVRGGVEKSIKKQISRLAFGSRLGGASRSPTLEMTLISVFYKKA
jgi:hypothetical protein